ncbi:LuxR C-terminal-related transcriptional regulator [Ideonella sp.]|uniref:LuxR C-terminal-related transcriptional regulator n=1 Tax=Ideonella sp. TaxID=1929293 RepID=UPI0035AD8F45
MRLDLFDVSQAPDKDTFQKRLVSFAEHMDFGLANGLLLVESPGRRMDVHYVGNMPADFAATSMDPELSARDPVMCQLKRMNIPFVYDQEFYVDAGAADLWDMMAPFGFKTGITVALHMPNQRHFVLGLDREQALPTDPQRLMMMLAELQLFAAHCQDAAVRLLCNEPFPHVAISDREREILRWLMHGKSKWEIGMILNVSENTVRYHVKRIQAKFHAPTAQAAVIRAMSAGLL